jgi:hypothetical protein
LVWSSLITSHKKPPPQLLRNLIVVHPAKRKLFTSEIRHHIEIRRQTRSRMAFVNIRNKILIFLQRGDESSGGSVHVDANLVAFFFVDPGNLKTQQFVVKKHNTSILMRC